MKRFYKNEANGQLNSKKTAKAWAEKFNIKFIDINGFTSLDSFNNVLIPIDDFMSRASCSTVERPAAQSRRDASKMKSKIFIK